MNNPYDNSKYYLSHGFDRDPFPINAADDIYFASPELSHRLELIRHLLEFSQQLILVTADPGSGKTALYHHIASTPDQHWSVSKLIADEKMDLNILTLEILRDTILDSPDISEQPINGLNKYLEYCNRKQILPILLLDDAHKLSIETLEFIMQLSQLKFNETRLRIILFGDKPIIRKLEDPRIKVSISGILHTINIPLFTLDRTSSYIKHRIDLSGSGVDYPFSEQDVKHIFKVSGGLPGNINLLARQALQDPATLRGVHKRIFSGLSIKLPPYISNPVAIGVILTFALAAYLLLIDKQAPADKQEVALVLPPEKPRSAQAKIQPVTSNTEDEAHSNAIEEPVVEMLLETAPVIEHEAKIELDKELAPLKPAIEQVDAPVTVENIQTSASVVADEPPEESQPSDSKTEKIAESTSTPIIAGTKGVGWLLQQPPDRYVLQLIGAHEQNTLMQFLQEQSTNKMAAFSTYNAGKPWYVLVYGDYPDRAAAAADISKLSADIKSQRPWPRSIASIHKDIKKQR